MEDKKLYSLAIKLRNRWFNSAFLNKCRRSLYFNIIKLNYKLRIKKPISLKLHLGCGNQHFEGYTNIDMRKTGTTDLVCNINKLPYPDNCVERIETFHVIEHLPRHNVLNALKEWYRVLVCEGKLVIECPDFDEIVRRYLASDEKQLDGIFGLQRFEGDYHFFGYNAKRLSSSLEESGFTDIEEKCPRDYHAGEWPCFRVECRKASSRSTFYTDQIVRNSNLKFNGERVVEGTTPNRIWLDHVARYEFAAVYVKDKTVLDVACGTGYGSKILNDKGARRVFGIDLTSKAIDFANENYNEDRLKFMVGNIFTIDFPDNFFDVIVCFETIEHIKDNQKALLELCRVLKPEGKLIISSPNRKLTSPGKSINDPPGNAFHEIEYTAKEFALVLSSYFNVSGLYGQRPIRKIFLLPLIEKILRRYLSQLFSPGAGSYEVEKLRNSREYRYIIANCTNPKA